MGYYIYIERKPTMKLLTLAATALVAATAIIAPAEARPNEGCGTLSSGMEYCISNRGYYTTRLNVVRDSWNTNRGFILDVNCQTGEWGAYEVSGYSKASLNGWARTVCTW
jgi:hypothetical protein